MNKKIHLPNFSSRENRWVRNILLFFIIISLVAGSLFFLSQDSNVSASPTIIFSDGFESSDYNAWTATSTGSGNILATSSVQKNHGTYSSKHTVTEPGNDCYARKDLGASYSEIYERAYVYVDSSAMSTGDRISLIHLWDGGTIIVWVALSDETRKLWLRWRDVGGIDNDQSATTLDLGTWYSLEVKYFQHSTNGEIRVYLNGSEVTDLTQTGLDTSPYDINRGYIGNWVGDGTGDLTYYIDDFVVADMYIGPDPTETIDIYATVSSWVFLQVTPTSTNITPDLVTTAGGVNIGESDYIQITGGTNNANGYSLDIKSLNAALCHDEGCATGTISSATATLVAGTDGYGAQATSSDGDVTIDTVYDHSTTTNDIGGMETTDQDLADTTGPSSDDITWLTFKAAATSTKPSGAYLDTITLTLIGGS